MRTVSRKSGKSPMQIETKSSCDKRFSDDEYNRTYSENLRRSGYCHKLPIEWREFIQSDSVLWFTNECTEFIVASVFETSIWSDCTKEELEVVGALWFMVCCPIQPSKVTREQTNEYWQSIKSPMRPDPEYPRFFDYLNVEDLPSKNEYIKGLPTHLHLFDRNRGLSLGLRFQPQYKVLLSMKPSKDEALDRWVAEHLVVQQLSYQTFCESAARQLFRLMRDKARDKVRERVSAAVCLK